MKASKDLKIAFTSFLFPFALALDTIIDTAIGRPPVDTK